MWSVFLVLSAAEFPAIDVEAGDVPGVELLRINAPEDRCAWTFLLRGAAAELVLVDVAR
jgi:hypothetical protein